MAAITSDHEHVWRTIPLKFLPVNDLNYTTAWAEDTYCYRYLFDDQTTSESYKLDSEVEEWQFVGNMMAARYVVYLATCRCSGGVSGNM